MSALTRTERIQKLSRAIWDYRGKYHAETGKWIQAPRPKAVVRIRHWLTQLGVVDVAVHIKRIDAFKHQDDFRKFLRELEKPRG